MKVSNIMHSWTHCIERALDKQLYRAIHLCRTSADYKLKYPTEVAQNPSGKILLKCTKEAEKRIRHEHEVRIRNNLVPIVERPKRFNRVG